VHNGENHLMFGIGPGQASAKDSSKMSSGGDAKLFARVRAFLLRSV